MLFGFWLNRVLIGYGGLVHICWANERAEISFLVDPERAVGSDYALDFRSFLALISDVAFGDMGLHRLTTETSVERARHLGILESCGFQLEGRLVENKKLGAGFVDSVIHARMRAHFKGIIE